MSEINEVTPEQLNEDIEVEVEDDNYVPTPVDPTLSHQGEAADAKATGDAIAAVLGDLAINEKTVDPETKKVTLYGGDIKVDDGENAKTLTAAIEEANSRTANDIVYEEGSLTTVKGKIDNMETEWSADYTQEEIDALIDEIYGGEE